MSLKAYNGMMTKKGFGYLQENIKANLPKFREASIDRLGEAYAEIFVFRADFSDMIDIRSILESKSDFPRMKEEIKKIEVTKDTTVLSYVFQCAKILSKSEHRNDFLVDLTMTIEQIGKKLLIYPGIMVEKHREILLSFLDDWNAQDQTDPPEDVPSKQWNQRCKDWYKFDETKGLQTQIKVFDPEHYWNNLVDFVRGDELIGAILKHVPSNEDRLKEIHKKRFLMKVMNRDKGTNAVNTYFKASDYMRSDEGQKEFDQFVLDNGSIVLTKIDEQYISSEKMPIKWINKGTPDANQLKFQFDKADKEADEWHEAISKWPNNLDDDALDIL